MNTENQGQAKKIVLVLPNLKTGGAERVFLALAEGFVQNGFKVDILLLVKEGDFLTNIPKGVKLAALFCNSKCLVLKLSLIGGIKYIHYLRNKRPALVLSTLSGTNLFTIIFSILSLTNTPVFVGEASTLKNISSVFIKMLIKLFYPVAQAIICVSQGVKTDLISAGIQNNKCIVINNPIDIPYILQQSKQPFTHPWYKNKTEPIIIGVGRLADQKGFNILIRAFSLVREIIPSKLIILGDGPLHANLLELCSTLGISEYVDLPGNVSNPYCFIKNSDVFALSSNFEGFVIVLLEAIALGKPIVATNCWYSPADILKNGKLGILVPVNDPQALAKGIVTSLSTPTNTKPLVERSRQFSSEIVVQQYIDLFNEILFSRQ